MYRTTAYVGHFLARFERNVKLYMACAALIGFSAFGIYSVLFNLYLLRMDYDVGSIGHFNAVGLLSFALFSPIAGNWAHRAGYQRTLVGGMSLMVMGYLLAIPISVFAGADKTAVATRTDTAPIVDGHLSDHCWDLAVPTTDFILLDPVEGAPAANQTVVKILYTADQLYIGLFMADSNAENIDARVVPRDGRFAPRDLIGILLDTQHDHRNAYGFYINPYGIQHDFQMTDDGAKGYGGNNKGWDGVWRAETAVLDSGWSAEVAIAFSTLSFAAGDDMVWGLNLERLSITGRERSHWAAIYQEDGSVLRVSKAGHLVGLRGIDPGLRLELLPYAASGVDRAHADWRGETAGAGLDVKYGVAANATLDITVNPDFAQIEADEEEINLSRFPLLLKERRPFFVENADFLGKHGLFYSRRIADPDFGAKFIGKAGEYTLGILTAQDRGEAGARPRFGVLKLQREVFHNSTVGALVEGVWDRGMILQQIAGLDSRVEWDDRYVINAYAARSAEQGSSGYISGADMSYRHGNFAGGVNYRSIESTFSADRLGFIERDRGVASQSVEFAADWRPRMRRLGKLNLGQAVSLEQRSVEDGWSWEWTTADVWLYTWDDSFVSAKHSVWRWPWQGIWYRGQTLEMGFDTGDGRKWKLDIGAGLQDRFDFTDAYFGTARSTSGTLELKPSASLTIEGGWSSVWEYLPDGAFDERKTIWRGRATYFATKRLFLRGFAQDAGYLDERDINLLASYEIAPKSRVYLAYNLGDTAAERAEKLRFKVAYLLSY